MIVVIVWSSCASAATTNTNANFACTATDLQTLVDQVSDQVDGFFTDIVGANEEVRRVFLESRRYPSQPTVTSFQQLTHFVSCATNVATNATTCDPPAQWVDTNPNRLSDQYLPAGTYTERYNATCIVDNLLNGRPFMDEYQCVTDCRYPFVDTIRSYCTDPIRPALHNCETLAQQFPPDAPQLQACPIYCQVPGQFNNSFTRYYFDSVQILDRILPSIKARVQGIKRFSYLGLHAQVVAYPSYKIVNDNIGIDLGSSCLWGQVAFTMRQVNPTLQTTFTLLTIDTIEKVPLISAFTPFYDPVDDFIGALGTDVNMGALQQLMDAAKLTQHSHVFLGSRQSGELIVVPGSTYDWLFCPNAHDALCHASTHFDLDQYLQDIAAGTYGFRTVADAHGEQINGTELLLAMQTIANGHGSVIIGGGDGGTTARAYVTIASLQKTATLNYVVVGWTPETDITDAAKWQVSTWHEFRSERSPTPQSLVVSRSELVQYGKGTNGPFWDSNEAVQLTNNGLLPTAYRIVLKPSWVHFDEFDDSTGQVRNASHAISLAGRTETFFVQIDLNQLYQDETALVTFGVDNDPLRRTTKEYCFNGEPPTITIHYLHDYLHNEQVDGKYVLVEAVTISALMSVACGWFFWTAMEHHQMTMSKRTKIQEDLKGKRCQKVQVFWLTYKWMMLCSLVLAIFGLWGPACQLAGAIAWHTDKIDPLQFTASTTLLLFLSIATSVLCFWVFAQILMRLAILLPKRTNQSSSGNLPESPLFVHDTLIGSASDGGGIDSDGNGPVDAYQDIHVRSSQTKSSTTTATQNMETSSVEVGSAPVLEAVNALRQANTTSGTDGKSRGNSNGASVSVPSSTSDSTLPQQQQLQSAPGHKSASSRMYVSTTSITDDSSASSPSPPPPPPLLLPHHQQQQQQPSSRPPVGMEMTGIDVRDNSQDPVAAATRKDSVDAEYSVAQIDKRALDLDAFNKTKPTRSSSRSPPPRSPPPRSPQQQKQQPQQQDTRSATARNIKVQATGSTMVRLSVDDRQPSMIKSPFDKNYSMVDPDENEDLREKNIKDSKESSAPTARRRTVHQNQLQPAVAAGTGW
jgi:hypothetical protein